MINNVSKNKGFTLIELLLYILISSTLLLAVSIFLFSITESRIKNQIVSEVEKQGIQVLEIISQTIRNSSSVNSPTPQNNSGILSLNTDVPSTNPTIFSLNFDKIQIQEGSNPVVLLTNDKVIASNLSFQNLSYINTPGIIQINFTLSYKNTLDRNELDYTKNFILSSSLRQP